MKTIPAKSILQKVGYGAQWFGIDYNLNLYKGCPHGCIYCDSRSRCYGIDHFDQVRIKENALLTLEQELKSKRKKGVVSLGSMSDTYNPYEQSLQLTRQALALIHRYGFGLSLETKSNLILRDLDLLKAINANHEVIIKMTITCADDALSSLLEPHVIPSSKRFETLQALNEAGIYAGILMMPILPFVNDNEENILKIVELAKQHKIPFIYPYFGVTLRDQQRSHYLTQLTKYFPKAALFTEQRYGLAYHCPSPQSAQLKKVFTRACRQADILYRMEDIIAAYRKKQTEQLQLF